MQGICLNHMGEIDFCGPTSRNKLKYVHVNSKLYHIPAIIFLQLYHATISRVCEDKEKSELNRPNNLIFSEFLLGFWKLLLGFLFSLFWFKKNLRSKEE